MTSPKSAYIFLTNRCNLDCKYCYEKCRTGDMSEDTMKATLDFIIQHYNKEVFVRPFENLTFTFFGGEPLLNFKTVKFGIEYLRKRTSDIQFKAGVHILTNGTILTQEMIDYFGSVRKQHNFNWHLQVSLDGCEETHNANRIFKDGEGSYSKIIENIKTFKTIFPSVGVRQTITPTSVKSFYKDFVSLIDLNVPITNFTPIVEGDWNKESLDIFVSELKKCVDYYYSNDKKQFFNLIHQSFERLVSPSFNRQRGCRAGLNFIGVSVDGKIYPCHRFVAYAKEQDYCIGDVWQGIQENSDNYRKIKEMRMCKVDCNSCEVFSCNRCFATNMMLMKDPRELPDNGYCEMNKRISSFLLPVIRRLVMNDVLKLKNGEMVDCGKDGVAFKVEDKLEIAADKVDVMARCILKLTGEIVELRKQVSVLVGDSK